MVGAVHLGDNGDNFITKKVDLAHFNCLLIVVITLILKVF